MTAILSAASYIEKNKLASPNVWLVLLKITMPDSTILRLAQNTELVIWPVTNGDTYVAFPFDLGDSGDSSKGEVPSVNLRVSNVTRILESYLEDQDGLVDSLVNIYVVNSLNIYTPSKGWGTHYDYPQVELEFKIITSSADRQWVNFTLGGPNVYDKRFPKNKVYKNICRYRGALGTENGFKGARCQYAGPSPVCDRSLITCRALGNSINFGGFPGVGTKGVYV